MSAPAEAGPVRSQCGTTWGYQLHRKHDEVTCDACRKAWATAERVRAGGPLVKRAPKPCGTRAAYQRHRRRREQPCEACRTANAAEAQAYELRKLEAA